MATATLDTPARATPNSILDSQILLEAGTNEVEILVFHVCDRLCGVNVAKVREVRPYQAPTFVPQSPEAVEGVVRIREVVVPAVDLRRVLWNGEVTDDTGSQDQHLLLEFNDQMIAFRVQGVDRIHRLSWKAFSPLPHCPGMDVPVTGIVLIEGRIVTILDFEAIGATLGIAIAPRELALAEEAAKHVGVRPPVVFADDSPIIRSMLDAALRQTGYERRRGFGDGQETWNYLEGLARTHTPESVREVVAAVISDIEMPRMDGFSLTRRIRENPVLKDLPVVLFSSLVSPDNEKKGMQVGATAQISKPRWEDLAETLLKVLGDLVTK